MGLLLDKGAALFKTEMPKTKLAEVLSLKKIDTYLNRSFFALVEVPKAVSEKYTSEVIAIHPFGKE